jgi:arylsulfatase
VNSRIAAALIAVAAVAVAAWAVATGQVRLGVAKPNVLLVTVDTLRADALGCYGAGPGASPGVDALAAGGVVFERAIAASSRTAPSHASIMTSLFVREHSIGPLNGPTRLADEETLAERFRSAGWATAAFIGNLMINRRSALDRGFDLYDDDLPRSERNREDYFERTADATTERALAWLARTDGPFFLWVHYQDPHGPYTPPAPYDTRFPVAAPPGEAPLRVLASQSGYQGRPGLDRLSQYRALYAGEVAWADEWIGRLVAAVDAHPSARPAVVLLTADHGESFGEDEWYLAHGSSTSPAEARVPFVLRAPGLAAGRRGEIVSHVDVMPTLLELASLPVPERARGIALGPYLREGRALPERIAYCDIGRTVSAYWPGHFARATGVGRAYDSTDPLKPLPVTPTWATFRWEEPGTWTATEPEAERMAEIRRYFERVKPLEKAPPLEVKEIDRLRALGYVSPE